MTKGKVPQGAPHPEPPARSPQALAFPDQLYDAVFDGAQVTSKTPIRLYGGALLSEYCWADAGKVMSNWGGAWRARETWGAFLFFVLALCFPFSCRVCLCWVCGAILRPLVEHRPWFGTVPNHHLRQSTY